MDLFDFVGLSTAVSYAGDSEPPTIILQLLPCSQLFVALFYLLLARPSLAPFSEMEAGGQQLSVYEMGLGRSVTR